MVISVCDICKKQSVPDDEYLKDWVYLQVKVLYGKLSRRFLACPVCSEKIFSKALQYTTDEQYLEALRKFVVSIVEKNI